MSATRRWTLLSALAALLILLAGWFLLISPKRSEAAALRAQTSTQLAANDQLRVKIANLKAQAANLPEERALLASIAKQLPDNPALPQLVRDLTSMATAANVDLKSMAPGTASPFQLPAPAAKGTTTTGTTPGTTTPATTAGSAGPGGAQAPALFKITVTLQVQGTYVDIERFLNAAESSTRKMLVTGFSLTPGAASGAGSGSTGSIGSSKHPMLQAAITAQVFVSPNLGGTSTSLASGAPSGSGTTAQ